MLSTRAADHGVFLAYVNLVGGQDELVFDGDSMVFDADGDLLAEAPTFVEHLLVHRDRNRTRVPRAAARPAAPTGNARRQPIGARARAAGHRSRAANANCQHRAGSTTDETREVYQALVVGTRDYVLKNGFKRVVLGLSGGIDSALVATVAVECAG